MGVYKASLGIYDLWMIELATIVMTSLATAAAAATLTRTHLFEGLRERMNGWLDCSYCTSHWIAAAVVLPAADGLYPFLLGWLATVGGSAILIGFVIGED